MQENNQDEEVTEEQIQNIFLKLTEKKNKYKRK